MPATVVLGGTSLSTTAFARGRPVTHREVTKDAGAGTDPYFVTEHRAAPAGWSSPADCSSQASGHDRWTSPDRTVVQFGAVEGPEQFANFCVAQPVAQLLHRD